MEHFEPETGNSGSRPSGWSGQSRLDCRLICRHLPYGVAERVHPGIRRHFRRGPGVPAMAGHVLYAGRRHIAPISGYLGSRFGYRRIFAVCMAWFDADVRMLRHCLEPRLAGRVPDDPGRVLGLVQPVTLALLYQNVPRAKQPQAVSVWSAASITATAVAPSASGWFQGVYWPMMFWVTVIPSAAAMLIGLRYLPEAASTRRPGLDGWGMFLAAAASAAYLMVFGNLHAWGLGSPAAIIGLLAGTLAFIVFVVDELRTPEPMLQLRLFASRTFTASVLISIVLIAALYAGTYFLPLYFQRIKMYTSFESDCSSCRAHAR